MKNRFDLIEVILIGMLTMIFGFWCGWQYAEEIMSFFFGKGII